MTGGAGSALGSAGLGALATAGRFAFASAGGGAAVVLGSGGGADFLALRADFWAGRDFVDGAGLAFRRTDLVFGADALARGLAVMGWNRPLVLPGPSLVGG